MIKKACLLLTLFFTGCMSGPNIAGPDVEIPHKFIEDKEAGKVKNVNDWWQNFYDEAINAYIDRTIQNNIDIQMTKEQIQKARIFCSLEKAKNLFLFYQLKEKVFSNPHHFLSKKQEIALEYSIIDLPKNIYFEPHRP